MSNGTKNIITRRKIYENSSSRNRVCGLSIAVLLAQRNTVIAVDIVQEKVEMINNRVSPIIDKEIVEYLKTKDLDLTATTDGDLAYKNADYVIISTPTNYDPEKTILIHQR